MGRFLRITHPSATRRQGCPRVTVRLACVKHAASVQSEPGSNSSVRSLQVTQSTLAPFPSTSVARCRRKQDSPPPPRFDPREQKLFASCEHQNFLKCLPGFHRRRCCQHLRLRPGYPRAPVPTLIGCEFLKSALARLHPGSTSKEARLYTEFGVRQQSPQTLAATQQRRGSQPTGHHGPDGRAPLAVAGSGHCCAPATPS